MTDKEFLDTFIIERIQMHMSNAQPQLTENEIAAALELEAKYNLALEKLPPETANTIKEFNKHLSDKLCEEQIFLYLCGIKDGLRLYRTLELENL